MTIPGSAGQFDITNQTGPNSSGDATFPVTTPVNLGSLALKVDFSDGTSQTFGSSYFTLDPFDSLSFAGTTIPIWGANPLPVSATLTGLFLTTSLTEFDGSTVTISPDFTAVISSGGNPLADGDFTLLLANTGGGGGGGGGSTVPEPRSYALMGLAAAAFLFFHKPLQGRLRTLLSKKQSAIRIAVIFGCVVALQSTLWAQVQMNVAIQPSSGVAGVNVVNAMGSGFPTSHGTISPANVTISLATTCGGSATASTPATSFRTIAGSLDRLGFLVPGTLAAGNYFVALSGTTSDGTKFSSVSGSCSRLAVTHTNATLAACIPTSSLAVNAPAKGGTVVAYVPNGCWSCSSTGVQAVVIEGSGTNASIPTVGITNSCSSNPAATGQTVCVANNTDVYLITGTAVTTTLHSESNTFAGFSGGSCETAAWPSTP